MVFRIATFGCWNNKRNLISDTKIAFEEVTRLIRQNNEFRSYNELVILGDNYYPNKIQINDKKIVHYDENEVNHGFCSINQIKIQKKYLIMGNHDLDDTLSYVNKDGNIKSDCQLLRYQMNLFKNKINVVFPFGSKIQEIDGIIFNFIFIDTTVYSYKDTQTTCTDVILGENYNTIKRRQNEFIVTQIQNNDANNIIIFGHEPLISVKKGKDEYKKNLMSELLNLIYDTNTTKKISYICADVHLYQSCKIRKLNSAIEIDQIVCGTGGAELDLMPETAIRPIIFPNINGTDYNIQINNFAKIHGYVELELTNSGLSHTFIPIPQTGGRNVRRYWINYQ